MQKRAAASAYLRLTKLPKRSEKCPVPNTVMTVKEEQESTGVRVLSLHWRKRTERRKQKADIKHGNIKQRTDIRQQTADRRRDRWNWHWVSGFSDIVHCSESTGVRV